MTWDSFSAVLNRWAAWFGDAVREFAPLDLLLIACGMVLALTATVLYALALSYQKRQLQRLCMSLQGDLTAALTRLEHALLSALPRQRKRSRRAPSATAGAVQSSVDQLG